MVHAYAAPVLTDARRDVSDQQLLHRFLANRDQDAFADLVNRHGRTVWGVCQRALAGAHDAEDAFQAVFLLLARKAASIRKGEAVGSWLYGVAHRTALKARQRAARRQSHEQQARAQGQTEASDANSPWGEAACRELQRILDEEVQRLPEKYRAPFVLCCLEGMSKAEAAQELGWKEGTVSGRLARARQHLQSRLARRGVMLSAVLTALALAQNSAAAAAPPVLVATTAQAVLPVLAGHSAASAAALSPSAVTLADGVVTSLVAAKIKAGLCMAVAVTTLAGGATLAVMQEPPPPQKQPVPPAPVVEVFEPDSFRGPPTPVIAAIDEQVLAFGFSNDGKRLITAGARYMLPGQIKIWDAATYKLLTAIKGVPGVRSLAVSPQGDVFATGDFGGNVKLRDGTTGAELKSVHGHTVGVNGVAFSADGKQLVSAGLDKVLKLWDAESLQEKKTLLGHIDMIYCVAFFKHGNAIVSGGKDKSARIWDLATGKEKFILEGHTQQVESVAVSPDDKTVVTAGWDQTIRFWDAESGKETGAIEVEGGSLNFVAFSPDGNMLAGAGQDGSVFLYDVKTKSMLTRLGRHTATTWFVNFSKDGAILASGGSDKTAKLWNVAERKEIATLNAGELRMIRAMAYAPDGKTLAIAADDKIQVRDSKTGDLMRSLAGHGDLVTCLAFSEDGQTLATGSADKTVKLWDWPTGKERVTLKNHTEAVHAVCFTRDGKLLSAGEDKIVRLWDPALDKETATFHGHEGGVHALAASPDGAGFASGSEDSIVRVWDFAKKNSITLTGHTGTVRALAYSPKGLLASAGQDATIKLWEPGKLPRATDDGKVTPERATLVGHKVSVVGLAFAPGGRCLVSVAADGVMVWDPDRGQPRTALRGHRGPATALAMHPQGRDVVSGSQDGSALRWHSMQLGRQPTMLAQPPGPPTRVLQGNPGGVWFVAFSPANNLLATGGAGGDVTLWSRALAPVPNPPIPRASYWDAAGSPDGRTFAVARGTDAVIIDGLTRQTLRTFPTKKILRSVTFSPDGKYLAATGGHWQKPNIAYEATIWDLASGKEVAVLEGHTATIYRAVFAHDGKTVATSSLDSTIRVWDFPSGKLRGTMRGHLDSAKGIVFLPDGTLVTSSWDKTIRFWDVTKLKQIKVWDTEMKMATLAVSSDGTMLAAADWPRDPVEKELQPALVRVWDVQTGKELFQPKGHAGHILGLCFTRDGRSLITGGGKLSIKGIVGWSEVSHYDLTTGQLRANHKSHYQWYENVAVGMNDQCVFGPANDFLNVFEFEFSHNLRTWKAHDATATCGVFAGNGKILVTGGADGSVRLWDTSANRLGSMTAHQDQVRSLAVLRDGKTTVSVSEDKTVKLWDNEKMILTDHKTPVMCVAVSQDGKLMATGGGDKSDTTPGELILWDLETRKPSKSLAVDKTVWSVAISPDGKWVAASLGNNTVQIFETAGGARRWTIGVMFKGMPFSRPVAFSHDGKFLAVGQGRVPSATEPGSGQVHLYDTSTWKLVSNLLPHGHVISQVAFAPDGRTIASASQDGTIKLTSHLGGVRFAPTTATPVAVRTLPPPLAKPLSADDVRQSLKETGAPQSQGGVTQTVTPETSGISTRVWLALAIAGILFVGLGVAWMRHRRGHGNGKSANVPASTPAKSSANSSSVSFSCPSCGKEMKAKAEFGGRTTRCPRCGTSLPIPSQTTPR